MKNNNFESKPQSNSVDRLNKSEKAILDLILSAKKSGILDSDNYSTELIDLVHQINNIVTYKEDIEKSLKVISDLKTKNLREAVGDFYNLHHIFYYADYGIDSGIDYLLSSPEEPTMLDIFGNKPETQYQNCLNYLEFYRSLCHDGVEFMRINSGHRGLEYPIYSDLELNINVCTNLIYRLKLLMWEHQEELKHTNTFNK